MHVLQLEGGDRGKTGRLEERGEENSAYELPCLRMCVVCDTSCCKLAPKTQCMKTV